MRNATLLAFLVVGILLLVDCGGSIPQGPPATPAVALSPNSLSFPDEAPGSASAPQLVSVHNSGTAPLQISGISIGPNFQEIDDCVSPLPAGAQCTINVTFAPTTTGTLQGTVTLTDNASGSPHNISLTGNGVISTPPGAPRLTGYCFGTIQVMPTKCALVQDTISCPVGKVAAQPRFVTNCLPPSSQFVDSSTSCHGKTTRFPSPGLTVVGQCVTAQ